MRIGDIVEFDKKRYFGGAVQANWFYDEDKALAIADSYVFHGPKYHGVEETESQDRRYRLYDTASYAQKLITMVDDPDRNNFCLTIASYGTGKSHLAVTLAALFSGHNEELRNVALERIALVDKEISADISNHFEKNLVVVLNGMQNFNLDHEILSVTRKALKQHGIDDNILQELTKQFESAKHFVASTFESFSASYDNAFADIVNGKVDAEFIINNLESNSAVFDAVNEVYKEINGDYMRWERGISAGDILELLNKKLCIQQKLFKRIVILFDEFGRYIEYAAANPTIAGDSALQQIFEAVQNADGNILFDGFIQSDLNSYLSRVDKSSSIVRYVGRFEQSEKYYISSNFETILANLITKTDERNFAALVENNVDVVYAGYHNRVHESLIRWDKRAKNRSVWNNDSLYNSVVSKGCYPLHPFAVWLLSNTSQWMQQRSTIAFAEQMFDAVRNKEISAKWLEYIYAVDIIDSDLFSEMLNSEERGLVQSQYCMLYRDVCVKLGDKLSKDDSTVLKAILIINLCKFELIDKNDSINAIRMCSGLPEERVLTALKNLENEHGVIALDPNTNHYDILAEASGRNEYQREFIRKRFMVKGYDGIAEYDEELATDFQLNNPEETPFAAEHQINSCEWRFDKRLIHAREFTSNYCQSLLAYFAAAIDGEQARGLLVYLYCGKNYNTDIAVAQKLYTEYCLNKFPILVCVLADEKEEMLDLLKDREALRRFSPVEQARFSKFIIERQKATNRRIQKLFLDMAACRQFVTPYGIEVSNDRVRVLCTKKFDEIYTKTIPFAFDGFERKVTPQVKKNFMELCSRMYDNSMISQQTFQSFAPPLKNRIQAVLSTSNHQTSWQVLDSRYKLCEPQNTAVKRVYNDIINQLVPDEAVGIGQSFSKYLYPPYGLNKYSLTLLILYVICKHNGKIQILQGNAIIKREDFSASVIQNEKKMYENLAKLKLCLSSKTHDDIIEDLLQRISDNVCVEQCSNLQRNLEQVKEELDGSSEFDAKIATANKFLKDGKRLFDQIYTSSLIPAEKAFNECKEQFSLKKLMSRVFNKVLRVEPNSKIEEYSDYEYSEEYCTRVNDLLFKSEALLDKNFGLFVKRIKCAANEITQFKSEYTKMSKMLTKINRSDYAHILDERVAEAVSEANLQAKYGQTFVEIDRDISFVGKGDNIKYSLCIELNTKCDSWLDFFATITDLDKKVKDDYITKLQNVKDILKNRMDYLAETAKKFVKKCKDNSGCNVVLSSYADEANEILASDLPSNISEPVQSISDTILCFRNKSNEIDSVEDFLFEFSGTICEAESLKIAAKIKAQNDEKRRAWIDINITQILPSITSMTASQCMSCQRNLSDIPDYLQHSDYDEIEKAREALQSRLKELKILGVLELYSALSDDEKSECLKRLALL